MHPAQLPKPPLLMLPLFDFNEQQLYSGFLAVDRAPHFRVCKAILTTAPGIVWPTDKGRNIIKLKMEELCFLIFINSQS